MVGVSNYKLELDCNGNGIIGYKYRNKYYRLVISKLDKECYDIFIMNYNSLSDWKNRHYAVARYIVRAIRLLGRRFIKVGHYYEIH